MQQDFSLQSYNYHLPEKNIAQHPVDQRDASRLLVLHHPVGWIEHRSFADIINLVAENDMLVINDTRVFPARLTGIKQTGGKIEVFLLGFPKENDDSSSSSVWSTATATALLKASKRPHPNSIITIGETLTCRVLELLEDGKAHIQLRYKRGEDLAGILAEYGQVPLPPYIERNNGTTSEDRERYQTVYADRPGAVAAPTAGLHFTDTLLQALSAKGICIGRITLHVGYGTFAPVRTEHIQEHSIHQEYVIIPPETAWQINATRKNGGKIWAIGTTTVRTIEFAADHSGQVQPIEDWCSLYIVPGYRFKVIDNLITNFHLPCSSLMFLVSALCGRETLLACYREAIEKEYRFYSYGDAMAIIKETAGRGTPRPAVLCNYL
jgi:S-adenosylmethionine:tRNA ribosyltransferase-isomerase